MTVNAPLKIYITIAYKFIFLLSLHIFSYLYQKVFEELVWMDVPISRCLLLGEISLQEFGETIKKLSGQLQHTPRFTEGKDLDHVAISFSIFDTGRHH